MAVLRQIMCNCTAEYVRPKLTSAKKIQLVTESNLQTLQCVSKKARRLSKSGKVYGQNDHTIFKMFKTLSVSGKASKEGRCQKKQQQQQCFLMENF